MSEYYVAWWNLENLFAKVDDPNRTDKLKRALGRELMGWTQAVLDRKLAQLASIIQRMNDGRGPDLLGVCEVESRGVLEQLVAAFNLPGRSYRVVHADTKDARGIDVAFLYDSSRLKTKSSEVFNHFILRRNATRDLLQASFYTKPAGNRIVVIGNHWPSRLGGEHASEPYRIMAAETLAYWHQRIHEVLEPEGAEPAVLAMGDFNDEPFNRSLVEYALSERVEKRVKSKRSQKPYFLNLMWALTGAGEGTHFYEGQPGMLDQILVGRSLLRSESKLQLVEDSVQILKFPEHVPKGEPLRFGRPAEKKQFNPDGFSDHLPVCVRIREKV
jgi:predicted extracellular nuclease